MKITPEETYKLEMIAADLLENNQGILAIDEGPDNFGKKLHSRNIANTKANREKFREILFKSAEEMKGIVKGIILHEETFKQTIKFSDGKKEKVPEYLEKKGFYLGIKVDGGLKETKNKEYLSKGIKKLEKKFKSGHYENCKFAKWRVVFKIDSKSPSFRNLEKNCGTLSEYARICHKYGKVPIIEPEILLSGDYNVKENTETSKIIFSHLFYHLNLKGVNISACLLKVGFNTAGSENTEELSASDTAMKTLRTLMSSVPIILPGVVFLSGGRTSEDSFKLLNSINEKSRLLCKNKFSFSFGRALTDNALNNFDPVNLDEKKVMEAFKKDLEKAKLAMEGKLGD